MATPDGPEQVRAHVAGPAAPASAALAPEPAAGNGANGADALPGTRAPELPMEPDPALRYRIAMAAESDLEASRYAHWRGMVTFHDVASAWFHMGDPNLPDELRAEFKMIFPRLLDAFAEPRKGIITSYFCRHIRVAAALTDIGHAAGAPEGVPQAALHGPPPAGLRDLVEEQHPPAGEHHGRRRRAWMPRPFDPPPASSSAIHIEPTFGDPEDWRAKEILFQCLHLHYKALEFLTPQPRKICMRMIFGVLTTLLGTLDHRQAEKTTTPFGADPREIETLEGELRQAEAYYERSAQRQAQLEYLAGMMFFLLAAGAATVAIGLTSTLLDDPLTVSLLGGATGAVVSVMNRMTTGRLQLRPESGKAVIRALGFIRPVIGAVFGAVVYLFLAGGVVQVVEPPEDANLAFYAGLGFISGFSERFAQDVIAAAGPPGRKEAAMPQDSATAR